MDIDLKQMVLETTSLAQNKNIPQATVHNIIEQSLAAAWRRDFGQRDQNVTAKINVHKGEVDIYIVYEVVDQVEDPVTQISLQEAQEHQPDIKVGQTIERHQPLKPLGRVAAQTAKQVLLQKLREAEREIVLAEYENKIGSIMNAVVTRVGNRLVQLEIGRARGIMPPSEQIQGENYYVGQRIKVLLKEIERDGREPQLILSRGSSQFLHLLFKMEVPEMENNAVQIKAIAREAGVRSKIAVASNVPNVDPVGTLVGGHGSRVKSVNSEIGDQEKIDIVVWDEDDRQHIINSLNPTEVKNVTITPPVGDDKLPTALVVVADDQLNIAIGRNGQNVRLSGRLTGYNIDIVDETSAAPKTRHRLAKKEQLEESLLKTIKSSSQTDTKETKTTD